MSQIAGILSSMPRVQPPVLRIVAEAELLNQVPYRNGDIFVCHEGQEEVMVDTVTVGPECLFINLVSLDKTFDGKPFEYKVSEPMLKKYYTRSGKTHPAMPEGNYSVTTGD